MNIIIQCYFSYATHTVPDKTSPMPMLFYFQHQHLYIQNQNKEAKYFDSSKNNNKQQTTRTLFYKSLFKDKLKKVNSDSSKE